MTIRVLGEYLSPDNGVFAEEMSRPVQVDVCIIGGGIAGLIVARELGQTGLKVVVLESGTEADASFSRRLNEVNYAEENLESALSGRFRGLGGSSARWGGRFLPLATHETEARPHLGLEPWPESLSDLSKHSAKLENLFNLPLNSYEEDAVADYGRMSGLMTGDPDFALRLPKWAPYTSVNLGESLRSRLQSSLTVEVWLDATVTKIDCDPSGNAAHVLARSSTGRKLQVKASQFVLAAGAIENARILLTCNRDHSGRIFDGDRGLGNYLQEHLGARVADLDLISRTEANKMLGYHFDHSARRNVHFDLRLEAQQRDGAAAAFAHVTMRPAGDSGTEALKRLVRSKQLGMKPSLRDIRTAVSSPTDITRGLVWRAAHKQHFWPRDLQHQLNVWIEQTPKSSNRIELGNESDFFGVPKAEIHWSISEQEYRTFNSAKKSLKQYWERSHLTKVASPRWTIPVDSSEADGRTPESLVPLNHLSGTTRMGVDARESVVNEHFQCHRIPNLSIAGASVFPSSGATGPTYTIGLMAFEISDLVQKALR